MLSGDKFMLILRIRQPALTYSACGPFIRHREKIKKFKETGSLNYIYKNGLDKFWFAHDAAYSDDKELAKRTISDKILKDRAYEIVVNPNKNGYQSGLASMGTSFLMKKQNQEQT